MLATTIHKSNTTPHHQRGATTTPPQKGRTIPGFPHSGQRDSGPVASKPNSVSGNPAPVLIKPDRRRCLLCTRTAPTTGTAHLTNRPGHRTPTRCGRAIGLVVLLRKEVIQPHLPVRLPCYDFVPIADPTFDGSLPRVRPPASGVTDFHDVTGGVYKARERIHRSVADLRLLATPTSRGRVADPDPN